MFQCLRAPLRELALIAAFRGVGRVVDLAKLGLPAMGHARETIHENSGLERSRFLALEDPTKLKTAGQGRVLH